MTHMGLGLPEREFHRRRIKVWPGYLMLALVMGFLILVVIATTPAKASECLKWPCWKKPNIKPVKHVSAAVKRTIRSARAAKVFKARKKAAKRRYTKARKKATHRHYAKKRTKAPIRVKTVTTNFKVSPKVVRALVRQESGGRCCIRSRAGALGKYQIMPTTARVWAAASGHPRLRRASYRRLKRALYTPHVARDIARTYINYYKRRYGHDELVLIAYNGGPKRARQAYYCLKRYGYLCVYRRETYNYVRSIFRMVGRKPMRMVCKCGRRRR